MSPVALFCWNYKSPPLSPSYCRMWAASMLYAKRSEMRTVLIADRLGIDVLVEGLKLPYDEILHMPPIPDELAHVYDIAKITALLMLAEQGRPAIMVDHDAFLRRPIPDRVRLAPYMGEFFYDPSEPIKGMHAKLPVPRFIGELPRGIASGVMGGSDCERITKTCRDSLAVALHPQNREILSKADGYLASTILGELSFGEAFPDGEMLIPGGPNDQLGYYRSGYMHACGLKKNAGSRMEMLEFFRHDFPEEFEAVLDRWDEYFAGH